MQPTTHELTGPPPDEAKEEKTVSFSIGEEVMQPSSSRQLKGPSRHGLGKEKQAIKGTAEDPVTDRTSTNEYADEANISENQPAEISDLDTNGKKKNGSSKQVNDNQPLLQFSVSSAPASVVASASNSGYYRKLNGTSTPILGRGGMPLEMNPLLPNNNMGLPPAYPDAYPSNPPPQAEEPCHIMEIPKTQLYVGPQIGDGKFGMMCSGLWKPDDNEERKLVFVKSIRQNHEQHRTLLEKEMRTIASFDHENVGRLFGFCLLEGERLSGIYERLEGCLIDFVEFLKKISERNEPDKMKEDIDDFLRIATQIAYGMEYLSSMGFTHRDLASRNVMLFDQKLVKISLFECKENRYKNHYHKMPNHEWMPVRWMPKEAIELSQFSEASDVWSFGVTLWEIFSYGRHPYDNLNNTEVIEAIFTRQLLDSPATCPPNLYSLMVECWTESPERRPAFSEIRSRLQGWSVNSPAHSLLPQQQRSPSSSTYSGSSGPTRGGPPRHAPPQSLTRAIPGTYQTARGPRRGVPSTKMTELEGKIRRWIHTLPQPKAYAARCPMRDRFMEIAIVALRPVHMIRMNEIKELTKRIPEDVIVSWDLRRSQLENIDQTANDLFEAILQWSS